MHPVLLLALVGAVAWGQATAPTPTVSTPLPFLRGVSIEKPTQLAFDHKEYAWVDWAACRDILAAHNAKVGDDLEKPDKFDHAFGTMARQANGQRAGDRAACMAVAAMNRLPGLNVLRVPIEPGSRTATRKGETYNLQIGDDGVISPETGVLDTAYLESLLVPILDVVKAENMHRQSCGRDPVQVILDWHYVAAGNGQGTGAAPWAWASVDAQTTSFWQAIAGANFLKEYDNVIYEVFNEPVLPEDGAGNERTDAEGEWRAGLDASVTALTEAGAKYIVMGAPRWSGRGQKALSAKPPADWWMQAEHCYTDIDNCQSGSPGSKGEGSGLDPAVAILATEVGADHLKNPDKKATPADMVRLLNQYEASSGDAGPVVNGWIAWVFAPKPHKPALLDARGCTKNKPCRLDQVGWTEWGKVVHSRLGAPAPSVAPTASETASPPAAPSDPACMEP